MAGKYSELGWNLYCKYGNVVLLGYLLLTSGWIYLLLCVCSLAAAEHSRNLAEARRTYSGVSSGGSDTQALERYSQSYYAGWCAISGHCGGFALYCSCRRQPIVE